jgi:autotransporter-associated beta strand protein
MAGMILAAAAVAGSGSAARGAPDLRLDVATAAFTSNNKSWFSAAHLPALAFPSANGHDIEQSTLNNTYNGIITGAGNTLGIYYNDYNTLFPTQTASQAVTTVDGFAKSRFGATATDKWLVLNEVDAATWNGSSGNSYRTWLIDTINGLSALGYSKIVLYSPRYLASKTYQTTWQTLASKSYIGVETYLDGRTIKNSYNYSLSQVQAYYQGYYNSWTSVSNGAGLPASRVWGGEHFSVNLYDPTHYWGANGISGADWQAAIQIRSIAMRNVPFGGFIGYAWQRNDQATGDDAIDLATQLSYERAYAATMVVQSEIPTWTGNSGTSTSWNDGFNWTGGLPSTTKHPFPLLATTNPNLPKQTNANFLGTIRANTTVTLDGDQSATKLAFGSMYSYTIAPGTGGVLTLTGSGATLDARSGSHTISAGLTLASGTAAIGAGDLTVSGTLRNSGVSLTKSGAGVLTISGPQNNAVNAALVVSAGTVNVNSDAGSAASATLAVSASGGTTVFNAPQHLASLQLSGGTARVNGQYLFTKSAAVSGTGTLDLTSNDLIVDYTGATSPLANLKASITTGFNAGAWTGKGITTSAGQTNTRTALGYAEASALLGLSGTAKGTFDGQTVDATTVLVKYTYYGDADLNGAVTLDDFTLFLNGYQNAGTDWMRGDFDYSGLVTLDDFTLFLDGYQNQGAPLSQIESLIDDAPMSPAERAAMLAAVAAVPEPTGVAALAIAAAAAMSTRRSRKLRP